MWSDLRKTKVKKLKKLRVYRNISPIVCNLGFYNS